MLGRAVTVQFTTTDHEVISVVSHQAVIFAKSKNGVFSKSNDNIEQQLSRPLCVIPEWILTDADQDFSSYYGTEEYKIILAASAYIVDLNKKHQVINL